MTRLREGQKATVLTLPTQPQTAGEAETQQVAYLTFVVVRASSTAAWLANDDPCRPGEPIHLEGARFMGLCERHYAGLQPPRQANRQCLRRKLQCHGSARMPRPALVPGSRRRPRKD